MTAAATVALVLVAAFVIGGIPWGAALVRLFKGVDIRDYGSGKTGATNVLRLLGWQGFAAAVALDALKGMSVILIARAATGGNPWVEAGAGFCAICGHTWSPFLGFRGGGRGMVTAVGAAFTMMPGLAALIPVFLIPVLISRYMSLGNIICALVTPVVLLVAALMGVVPWAYFCYILVGCVLILANHKDNIQRLLAGTERKIGEAPTPSSSSASV